MKKEIEVYIAPSELESFSPGADEYISVNSGKHEDHWLKAKLIVELPEKSVTITESEFQEAFDSVTFDSWGEFEKKIKQKLFGEKS